MIDGPRPAELPSSSDRPGEWAAAVFNGAPLGSAITTADGTLLAVNPAFASFLGYSVEELVGRHVRDITDPRDAAASIAGLGALAAGTTKEFRQQKRYVRADGTLVWARTSAAALRGQDGHLIGFIAQMEEIGERLETERRLGLLDGMFSSVFASSPIPKVMIDRQGTVLAANDAMLAMTNATSPTSVTWSDLFAMAQPDEVRSLRRLPAGETLHFECQVRRPGKAAVTVLVAATAAESAQDGTQLIVQMVDITERKAALASAVHRSLHDELTGLPNRRHFDDCLQAALSDRRTSRRRLAVFMVDIDHFREINNGLGHGSGDEVLVEVARRIQSVCRHGDTVGRIGGDEFWVLAHNIEDECAAIQFSTMMLRAMSPPFLTGGTNVHVGVSIGFALAPSNDSTATELMRKADSAQYRAKQGRSGWAAFSTQFDQERLDRLQLARDLKTAIDHGKLHVAYQPMYGAAGDLTGFEALARWQHPRRGAISPDYFIPLAEQSFLMQPLTRAVLRRAITQCAIWREDGNDVGVAVNVAPSLLYDDSLRSLVKDELASSGLDPAHLTLEMTEGLLADGSNTVLLSTLTSLRDLGVRLSIDDFGTGYSSLGYLKTLPITELKIDRSFITDIAVDTRDVAIVRALVQLAKTLNLHVVAEGVETNEAAHTLRSLGCDTLQGFALGRPMSPQEATELLAAPPGPQPTSVRVHSDTPNGVQRSSRST